MLHPGHPHAMTDPSALATRRTTGRDIADEFRGGRRLGAEEVC